MAASRGTILALFLVAAGWPGCATTRPQGDSAQMIRFSARDLRWSSHPALPGLPSIVMAGDPNKSGPYAMRVKLPANFKADPHWHTDEIRMITILSGILYFGYGDRFDESKLKALGPGSFFTEPKYMPHFAVTREDEVILQLDAVGPTGTVAVRAAGGSH